MDTQITANANIGKLLVKKAWSGNELKCSLSGTRYEFGLHFDKVPIFQYEIRVTLQGGEVAYTVVD